MKLAVLLGLCLLVLFSSYTHPERPQIDLTPQISSLLLTSPSGLDLTNEDLICSHNLTGGATIAVPAWRLGDTPPIMPFEGDSTTAATSWYVSGSSLTLLMALLLPFAGGAVNVPDDFSGNGITTTPLGDPTWNLVSICECG